MHVPASQKYSYVFLSSLSEGKRLFADIQVKLPTSRSTCFPKTRPSALLLLDAGKSAVANSYSPSRSPNNPEDRFIFSDVKRRNKAGEHADISAQDVPRFKVKVGLLNFSSWLNFPKSHFSRGLYSGNSGQLLA